MTSLYWKKTLKKCMQSTIYFILDFTYQVWIHYICMKLFGQKQSRAQILMFPPKFALWIQTSDWLSNTLFASMTNGFIMKGVMGSITPSLFWIADAVICITPFVSRSLPAWSRDMPVSVATNWTCTTTARHPAWSVTMCASATTPSPVAGMAGSSSLTVSVNLWRFNKI